MTDAAAVVRVEPLAWVDEIGDHPMPWRFWEFAFYEPLAGWVTGQLPTAQWELGHTLDGGLTWHAAALPGGCEPGGVVTILFKSATVGWARCQEVLWSTGDGGQTWNAEMPVSMVVDWGRTPAGFYWAAIERTDGLHLLELSAARASDWRDLVTLPQAWTLRGLSEPATIPIVVGDAQHLWVYIGVRRDDGTIEAQGWRSTQDGGLHWDRRELPCGPRAWGLDTGIALAPDGTLWSQCWGIPAGTYLAKSFWRSNDGGRTWQEIARSRAFNSVLQDDVASLPFTGITWRLDVFNARFAYSLLSRVDVPMISRDGGASWHTPWLGPCLEVDGAPTGTFFDDRHGYFASLNGMARTADGGLTWECLEYPPQASSP